MAEIRFLPAHPVNPDQVHRLTTELAAAHARGLDLGPRGPHIEAIGETLRHLTERLESLLATLPEELRRLDHQKRPVQDLLERLLGTAQQLARKAEHFSDDARARDGARSGNMAEGSEPEAPQRAGTRLPSVPPAA